SGANGNTIVVGFAPEGADLGPTNCTEITKEEVQRNYFQDENLTGNGEPVVLTGRVPYINQGAPGIGTIDYSSAGHSGATIKSSGCGIASLSMAFMTFGDRELNGENGPAALAKIAQQRGWRRSGLQGTDWAMFPTLAKERGLAAQQFAGNANIQKNMNAIMDALRSGKVVVFSGRGSAPFTTGGHFFL